MKGCKPLSKKEVKKMLEKATARNKLLLELGRLTGLRISELLPLKISDVFKNGEPVSTIYISKKSTKGKIEGKAIPLCPYIMALIKEYVLSLRSIRPSDFLFKSRKGSGAITRVQAFRILQKMAIDSGVDGKVGTHSMRKTFANNVYKALGNDLVKTQHALHHKSITSTTQYLSIDAGEIESAILSME